MAYTPPTVAEMEARVYARVGRYLAEVGLYAPAEDGSIALIRDGIGRGVLCVGNPVAVPSAPTDDDLAYLTTYSTPRVEDEAVYWCLTRCVAEWYRAIQRHVEPVAPVPMAGGWLAEMRSDLKAEVARLRTICDEPYREPSPAMVIESPGTSTTRPAADRCLPDHCLPGYGWEWGWGWWE